MEVSLAIGQNHRFVLREALLIYKGGQHSFVTHHAVVQHEGAAPSLGPAQPLTFQFVDALNRSLRKVTEAEVLPDNVLAKGDESLVWWTPRRTKRMYYTSSTGACAELDAKLFPQPALVWRVTRGGLAVRALHENRRPGAETKLAFAPFWNLAHDGDVCLGSMRRPNAASVRSMALWEEGFYDSAFTHGNVARITKHVGGFEAMWSELAGSRKTFPSEYLIGTQQTLAQFVR